MADFVVGASLKARRDGSLYNNGSLVTSPIPFSGLRSIDCGAQNQNNGIFLPSLSTFEYSFYNDFTIEMFLRGDGTTNDGGFINQFGFQSGSPSNLLLMIDGDELQLNNYLFPGTGYRKKIGADIGTRTTTDWYHFACVRKNGKISLFWNGNRVAHDVDSAGNGTADYIDIESGDAYLFGPMGGNVTSGSPAKFSTMQIGNGGNKPSDQSADFYWGGYIANYRTSYIAQYDPSSSTYTVPSAPFSNFSGTTTYYKDATNNDFFNESDNLPTTFNDLVLENTALGTVTTVEENNKFVSVELNQSLAGIALGNITTLVDEVINLTGISLTSSVGGVGAGLGILVPVTQPTTANVSLGDVEIPIMWSKIQTGTTTNWKEVDTG